jgi:7 transmembrane receptor (Secretin family).
MWYFHCCFVYHFDHLHILQVNYALFSFCFRVLNFFNGTIVTFSSFFSKINRKLAPKLLICLSSSLIILLVVFIIGAEQTEHLHVCQLMAVLIHYFVLSTFCWMACEGFNLYRNFINIFKRTRNENTILLRMSLFSWGK